MALILSDTMDGDELVRDHDIYETTGRVKTTIKLRLKGGVHLRIPSILLYTILPISKGTVVVALDRDWMRRSLRCAVDNKDSKSRIVQQVAELTSQVDDDQLDLG
ncbi:hypothetical protein CROQUDRAFT_86491 [Cronartium quercuum f. sp. fusiforme G11]|uniref:Uncharacterized protein n=1 Tax=Cronartium quercuum f. sp. fusiforme G11 TaxID=708437 RepID=A0A9P6NX70_9BASI|nr:hypothetical protein CROQUDRAFT_86491 [Cronartium quercuum f. sp. fusiforme G11]